MKPYVTGLLIVGVLLLILSGMWSTLFPATSAWTPEKSVEWTKVKDRLHVLTFIVGPHATHPSMHSGPDTGQAKAEYEELKIRHATLSAEFDTAHDRPILIARFLKWAGITLAAVGAMGVYAINQQR